MQHIDDAQPKQSADAVSQLLAEAKKRQEIADIKPIGTGDFGEIYDQFKGKPQEAIDFLTRKKGGEAIGALHHKQVGDIDLVWGDEKRGLEHIITKHPEIADNLQSILDGMAVVSTSPNRIVLDSPTHRAVVSKDWYGKPVDNWLLTAYGKKNGVSGGSIDIVPEPEGKQNGTATLQNANSADKGSVFLNTSKENTAQSVLEGYRDALQKYLSEEDKVSTDADRNYAQGYGTTDAVEMNDVKNRLEMLSEKVKDLLGEQVF